MKLLIIFVIYKLLSWYFKIIKSDDILEKPALSNKWYWHVIVWFVVLVLIYLLIMSFQI